MDRPRLFALRLGVPFDGVTGVVIDPVAADVEVSGHGQVGPATLTAWSGNVAIANGSQFRLGRNRHATACSIS